MIFAIKVHYKKHGAIAVSQIGYKTLIRKVMFERRLPICSANGKGYFWATTKEEIQMTIDDLQGRIEEMQNRIEHLKSFIIN